MPTVSDAIAAGEYTDGYGETWLKREVGWTMRQADSGDIYVIRDSEMESIIRRENQ